MRAGRPPPPWWTPLAPASGSEHVWMRAPRAPEATMIDIKPDALRHVAGRGGHVTLYYQPLRGC